MQIKHQETKQWLSRARNLQKRLNALQESKRQAYDAACSSTATLRLNAAAQVKSTQPDNKAAQYAYLSAEMDKQLNCCDKMRTEIARVIAQVPDNTLAALLIEYYINNKSWEEVANALRYSYQDVVQRKHPAALRAVAALLKDDKE